MSLPLTSEAETRVLLIEDDLAFSALILAYLSEFPHINLDAVSTLTTGLNHLRRESYDAILLDLNLSDSRGVVTLKTVREHAPRVPIVVLTSTDEDDLAIELLQNGAEEYVVKSAVRLNKLVRVIKVAIERRKVTERLALLESVLLLKQREDFAAVLTHDLKTPVIGLNRLLGILLSDTLGPLTKEQRDLLLLMQKDSEHSLQKIQNVLEVFRFNISKNELNLVPIDLVPIITDCISQQKASATARGDLQFQVDSPQSVPNVIADEVALRKVLINILDNATKFSPANATITLKVTDAKDSVSLEVHDRGPGIAKDLQPLLFDRIWQGGPKSQYTASTGLGLYVCKQLINAHDGTIECVSETGENSSCSIIITLKKRSDA